jgi:hypothetical protein
MFLAHGILILLSILVSSLQPYETCGDQSKWWMDKCKKGLSLEYYEYLASSITSY